MLNDYESPGNRSNFNRTLQSIHKILECAEEEHNFIQMIDHADFRNLYIAYLEMHVYHYKAVKYFKFDLSTF